MNVKLTSSAVSGRVRRAAPMPPLTEKDFGHPMFTSMAATSRHLKAGETKFFKRQKRENYSD